MQSKKSNKTTSLKDLTYFDLQSVIIMKIIYGDLPSKLKVTLLKHNPYHHHYHPKKNF